MSSRKDGAAVVNYYTSIGLLFSDLLWLCAPGVHYEEKMGGGESLEVLVGLDGLEPSTNPL